MSRTLELPEPIYEALVKVARASGVAPAEWIASKLPPSVPPRPSYSVRPSLERLLGHAGSLSLGHHTGTDNEGIDSDLAREYGASHEELL